MASGAATSALSSLPEKCALAKTRAAQTGERWRCSLQRRTQLAHHRRRQTHQPTLHETDLRHLTSSRLICALTVLASVPHLALAQEPSATKSPTQNQLRPIRPKPRRRNADDESRRADFRQPKPAQGRRARAGADRGLHVARKDHALRSRAHPGADRPCARLGRARLFPVLQIAERTSRRRRSCKTRK